MPNDTDVSEGILDHGPLLADKGLFIPPEIICADKDDESCLSNLREVQESKDVAASVQTQHHVPEVCIGYNTCVTEGASILQHGASVPDSPETIPVLTKPTQSRKVLDGNSSKNLHITSLSDMMTSPIHASVLGDPLDRSVLAEEKDGSSDAVETCVGIPDCRILDHIQHWLHLCYTFFILLCLGTASRVYWCLLSAEHEKCCLLQEKQGHNLSMSALHSAIECIKSDSEDLQLARNISKRDAIELRRQINEDYVHRDEKKKQKVSLDAVISDLRRQLKNEKAHTTEIQRSKKDLDVEVERMVRANKANVEVMSVAKAAADRRVDCLEHELGTLKTRSEELESSRQASLRLITEMEKNHKIEVEITLAARLDLENIITKLTTQAAVDGASLLAAAEAATLQRLRIDDIELLLTTCRSRYEEEGA